tara:strand:+ start:12069 stop:12293 length:225 start_codon:yes stop_codon:yes gene_type:complete
MDKKLSEIIDNYVIRHGGGAAQMRLATNAGVSQRTIMRAQRGERQLPKTVYAIAVAAGLTESEALAIAKDRDSA